MRCNCLQKQPPADAGQAYQEVFEGLIVGDDAVMYNNKFMFIIRYMRVAVDGGRLPVCCPSCVRNASMTVKVGVQVYVATSQLSVCLIN